MLRLMVICAFLLLTGCENRIPKVELKADTIKILEAEINMHQRKIDELKGTATGDGTVLKKAGALRKLKKNAQEKLDALLSNK